MATICEQRTDRAFANSRLDYNNDSRKLRITKRYAAVR